jgi:MoaA/NifB/PqqE/SkfB family radical SAM enzyme
MLSTTEKKWRLFRAWASRRPVWCAGQVTYRCNFRCKFCHYWHDPLGRRVEPSVADYRDGARKLASYGTLMVSIAGGEPMLRTDLPDIVRAVGEYHFPFVTTNGWFVTPRSAAEIMKAGASQPISWSAFGAPGSSSRWIGSTTAASTCRST